MSAHAGLTGNRLLFFLFCFILCSTLIGCLETTRVRRRAPRDVMNEKRWFVHDNPNHPQAKNFLKELDDYDFQRTTRTHTARAYKEYLDYHFDGKYVRRARYWWEQLMYQEALESKKTGALEEFLKRFPEGWFESPSDVDIQKSEYEVLRGKDEVVSYRAFIKKYEKARSEWTEAATQRLERLLLDAAKASSDVLELERFVFDNPYSPYLDEAKDALRAARFGEAMRSEKEADWKAFIRRFEGSKEAALMQQHMEARALAGAERSGRVSALEQFLVRYPGSVHKGRILSSINKMAQEKNQQVHRWVRVKNAEVEVYRKPRCKSCRPYLRSHGTLINEDPDFSFDVGLQVELIRNGKKCCRTRHWLRGLRPGESRPFSFPIRGKSPKRGSPAPRYEIEVISGSAYRNPQEERIMEIEGLGGKSKGPQSDRFAPVRVPDLN
ncbi:MAG: hypothetical protein OXL41_09185 [Nitrospinae bacterium]|nr:hypothetical protein [Nitrospinota bacterium]